MEEVLIKSHLIVTDVHEEYEIKWIGKILDTKPQLKNNQYPIFVVVGSEGRIELATVDIKRVEECAKRMTQPRGRSAITSDSARIYIKEVDDKETLLGIVTHKHIKTFAPMYDKIYRN